MNVPQCILAWQFEKSVQPSQATPYLLHRTGPQGSQFSAYSCCRHHAFSQVCSCPVSLPVSFSSASAFCLTYGSTRCLTCSNGNLYVWALTKSNIWKSITQRSKRNSDSISSPTKKGTTTSAFLGS